MRDNFAKGVYPTLDERNAFAETAADHVEACVADQGDDKPCVISFSFVNEDLRCSFRNRFPLARWVLVDTSEDDAAERIARREGHFYKGPTAADPDRGSEWSVLCVISPGLILKIKNYAGNSRRCSSTTFASTAEDRSKRTSARLPRCSKPRRNKGGVCGFSRARHPCERQKTEGKHDHEMLHQLLPS